MFCQRAYRCCSAVNDLLVTSYFIPCIRGAKKSMVNQIPEYTNFFNTNKNSLYLLRNRGKEIVLPTSCTSYGHLTCSGLSTIRVSYRSRQGTRPCQRLPLWSETKHKTCTRSNNKEKDFGELQHVSVLRFYLLRQSRSLFYNSCWHEKINVNTQFMTSTTWTMVWSPN